MTQPSGAATPPLRIAMLGMRGVPANYGGLESVAEEVGARLVERGHIVTVYCRGHNSTTYATMHRGMRRIVLPSPRQKYLDTPLHTAVASAHALAHRSDVVHVFGVGNAAWLPLLRRAGRATVISVDGMDWRRRKWGRVAKFGLERSSVLAARLSDACITDSQEVARYYAREHGRHLHYIAHGVDPRPVDGTHALETYGLQDRGYLLFVGRLTPEKGVHYLIDAFRPLDTARALVIVGEAADPSYAAALRERAECDPRVRLLGPLYGDPVRELFAHDYVYVQPSEIEGTALSLVEAMGYGNCVVVSDIPENLETVGEAGISFDAIHPVASLHRVLADLLASPERVERHRAAAKRFAIERYSWDRVTDEHERLYREALARHARRVVPRALPD